MNRVVHLETDKRVAILVEGLAKRTFPHPYLEFTAVNTIGQFKIELASTEPLAAIIVGIKDEEFKVGKETYPKMLRTNILSGAEIIFHSPEDPNFPQFDYYFVGRKQRYFDLIDALRTALGNYLPPELQ